MVKFKRGEEVQVTPEGLESIAINYDQGTAERIAGRVGLVLEDSEAPYVWWGEEFYWRNGVYGVFAVSDDWLERA